MAFANTRQNKKRKKYPGFRPCLNHGALSEFFKNEVPTLCPTCFAIVAKNQIQIVALNHCSIEVLRQRLYELEGETDELRKIIEKLLPGETQP